MAKKQKEKVVSGPDYEAIAAQAYEEYDVAVDIKKPRVKQWQIIEDLYSMKVEPALYGRFNIPLPIMSGFVHLIKANIDNRPVVKFTHDEQADYLKAQKITAAHDKLTNHPLKNWSRVDRMVKHLAIMQGIGTYAIGANNDDEGFFDHYFEAVDGYDFLQDAAGGAILENQNYCGRDNFIKTSWDLEEGVKERGYNKANVAKLLAKAADSEQISKAADEVQQAKSNRWKALGMDFKQVRYASPSQVPFKMTEFITTFKGQRWYLIFHRETKIWVKCCPLKEVFESGLYPYVRWAPFDDPMNCWPLAPAEEMIPVTDAMQTLINQAFENRQKINWGQRAYDYDIFPDPSELEYIEEGLVVAKVPAGKSISDGIYTFETKEIGIQGTINLANFLDTFTGKQTGATAGTQGAAERDKKVGVLKIETAAVSQRFGLTNKEYEDAWQMLGLHFLNGLREHMDQPMMVRVIGEKGFKNEELTVEELNPTIKLGKAGSDAATTKVDFNIVIQTTQSEDEAAAILSQRKIASIQRWIPLGVISKSLACEMDLRESGWEDDDIKVLLDVENEGSREILAEAAEENEQLGQGQPVTPNRGASLSHIQRHIDFANDTKFSDDPNEDAKIVALIYQHAAAEIPLAIENKKRDLVKAIAQLGQATAAGAPAGTRAGLPMAGAAPAGPTMPSGLGQ